SHSYYAIAEDVGGHTKQTGTINVYFNGAESNDPPVITNTEPADQWVASETEGILFETTATDPDGDTLTYEYRVNNVLVQGPNADNTFDLQRSVNGATRFYVDVRVRDATHMVPYMWEVWLTDSTSSVDLSGDETLTECEEGAYTATVDTNDNIQNYTWNWGDGSAEEVTTENTNTHIFSGDGTWTVTVTIADDQGHTDVDNLEVVVYDEDPAVTILAPTSGSVGIPVDLGQQVVAGCNDALVDYEWGFGDGNGVPRGPVPVTNETHTYMTAGIYDVNLTVWDTDGFGQDVHQIEITNDGPLADFTWDPDPANEGEEVNFTDTSTPSPGTDIDEWSWDFDEDGQEDSNEQNPSYTFPTDGNYSVTLTVTDTDSGLSDSQTYEVEVLDNPPVIDFTSDVTDGDEPLDVEFTCTYTGGNDPVDVEILFDDGTSNHQGVGPQFVNHTFLQEGNYSVVCRITDADLDEDQATINIEVFDTQPVIDFTWDPDPANEGDEIQFNESITSHDSIVTIEWDFDDDGNFEVSGSEPTHTFQTEGNYTVTLRVDDGDGPVTHSEVVEVLNVVPSAELTVDPTTGEEMLTVDVTCTNTGGSGTVSMTIDFGDGTVINGAQDGLTYSHPYIQNGTYDVECTVVDTDLDDHTDIETVTVTDTDPVGGWTADPTDPVEGEVVQFDAEFTAYDDSSITYSWDFNDGSVGSSDEDPLHIFNESGTYNVAVTVTDGDGTSTTVTGVIVVGENIPDVMLTATPMAGPEGTNVTFDCVWTDGNGPFEWYIDFDDGSPVWNQSTVSHVYALEDTYNATCVVEDVDGDTGSDFVIINIDDNVPTATIEANPDSGLEPLDVSAVCNITNGNGPFDYEIDFGDGTVVIGDDEAPTFGASHTYLQNDTYTITCDVTDVDDDNVVVTTDVVVLDSEPQVSWDYSPLSPVEGDVVDFTSYISAYDGVVSMDWDFDDSGATSTDGNTTHVFNVEGDYNVSLTVEDGDGSIVVVVQEIHVGNFAPDADFWATPLIGPENTNVSFHCGYNGGNEIVTVALDVSLDGVSVFTSTDVDDWNVFTEPGTYMANCTVRDADGDEDSEILVVNIDNNPPVIDAFNVDPIQGEEGDTVDFECVTSGGDAPLSYEIGYGYNNLHSSDPTSNVDSYTYGFEGNYTAYCNVSDADGDWNYLEQNVEILNNPPGVNLVPNVSSGLENLDVEFTCNVYAGNGPFVYTMDFGDQPMAVTVGPTYDTSYVWTHTYDEGVW
ncbi:PKD domain-containing protein, partial [Nanoarchaeota archaeon]